MKKFIKTLFLYTCVDIKLYFAKEKLNPTADSFFCGVSFAQLVLIRRLDLLNDFITFAAKRGITEGQIYEILN